MGRRDEEEPTRKPMREAMDVAMMPRRRRPRAAALLVPARSRCLLPLLLLLLVLLAAGGVRGFAPAPRPRATGASASPLRATPLFDGAFQSASSSFQHAGVLVAEEASAGGLASTVLHSPTLWSVLAMTSIVALLVSWEEAVENLRENLPKPITPVIDSMLAEVGGLGFIGLFLSTVVTGGPLGQVVGSLSEEFLGDEELLLETFEFLHTFFFQVGILFFVVAGVVVGAVLADVQSLSQISECALDADGDGEVTLDELAAALDVESMVVDADGDGIVTEEEKVEALRAATPAPSFLRVVGDEYVMSNEERAGEQLVIRARMMERRALPQTFAVEDYFAQIFGRNLEEVVELSPVTWLPLIPLIALDNSVDLTRDVVSASSSNAFDSCGFFFATPWVLYSTLFLQALSLAWAVFNYWKVSSIKKMLLPTLVKEHSDSEAILLPPRYLDDYLLERFDSSPSVFRWGERLFAAGGDQASPPRNAHERLFGALGAKFPGVFRDSIRFHTWLCVAQIVYSTTQIIYRDGAAMYLGGSMGSPETALPELALWSAFVASAAFQLSLAPTTFLNYCFVTSVEEFVKIDALRKSFPEGVKVDGNVVVNGSIEGENPAARERARLQVLEAMAPLEEEKLAAQVEANASIDGLRAAFEGALEETQGTIAELREALGEKDEERHDGMVETAGDVKKDAEAQLAVDVELEAATVKEASVADTTAEVEVEEVPQASSEAIPTDESEDLATEEAEAAPALAEAIEYRVRRKMSLRERLSQMDVAAKPAPAAAESKVETVSNSGITASKRPLNPRELVQMQGNPEAGLGEVATPDVAGQEAEVVESKAKTAEMEEALVAKKDAEAQLAEDAEVEAATVKEASVAEATVEVEVEKAHQASSEAIPSGELEDSAAEEADAAPAVAEAIENRARRRMSLRERLSQMDAAAKLTPAAAEPKVGTASNGDVATSKRPLSLKELVQIQGNPRF